MKASFVIATGVVLIGSWPIIAGYPVPAFSIYGQYHGGLDKQGEIGHNSG